MFQWQRKICCGLLLQISIIITNINYLNIKKAMKKKLFLFHYLKNKFKITHSETQQDTLSNGSLSF